MHCTFLSTTLFFPPLQETGEAGKIRSDLKKFNASWSIGRGRLARETFANKWQRISEQNAGVRPATPCEFCSKMRTCRMSKNAVLILPTKWKKQQKISTHASRILAKLGHAGTYLPGGTIPDLDKTWDAQNYVLQELQSGCSPN